MQQQARPAGFLLRLMLLTLQWQLRAAGVLLCCSRILLLLADSSRHGTHHTACSSRIFFF
jgi:hypothetical protein